MKTLASLISFVGFMNDTLSDSLIIYAYFRFSIASSMFSYVFCIL
jgi:hypothetical protein